MSHIGNGRCWSTQVASNHDVTINLMKLASNSGRNIAAGDLTNGM